MKRRVKGLTTDCVFQRPDGYEEDRALKLRVIWVGKTREAYLREGIHLYRDRIRRYHPLDVRVVPGEKVRSKSATDALLEKEAHNLLKVLDQQDKVVILDAAGTLMTSETFSRFLGGFRDQGTPRISFLIGGPLGLGQEIRNRADYQISLSPMTLTHEMARLLLLEQIYRAMTIIAGGKYHK